MNAFSLKKTPLYAESWNVAFRKTGTGNILEDTATPFIVIRNNFRYWAADPFVVEHEGKAYIFAELYDYILRRGVLGYCQILGNSASKWQPIIQEPYHLSYPCLTKSNGTFSIMPESGAGNELAVYEAGEFPEKWKKCAVLRRNVKFADTTPLPHPEKQLALTHKVDDADHPQLMLLDLNSPGSDTPIQGNNPLRTRPAGHVFEHAGKLIRPAQFSQDVGTGYGKGLIFCQCHLDDDLSYRETERKSLLPEDLKYDKTIFLDGMHTYNSSQHYEVIDIKTRRFNILNFVMRIAGKILRH